MDLREYQKDIANVGVGIAKKYGFVYLAMQVRTGKTITSFSIANDLGASNVLFITKKKAIRSIELDYEKLAPQFNLSVINYESVHHVCDKENWDVVICDEAHCMGAFPKPSSRAISVGGIISKCPYVIFLSGTPTPESYSQMYHQVYKVRNNPFGEFGNFYKFAKHYVDIKQKKVNGFFVNDYSNGRQDIINKMEPYTLSYTQKEAGFYSNINETVLFVTMKNSTYGLINRLKKNLVIEGNSEVILADTSVKLMTKIHQLYSGTIKFESGNSMVIDDSKALFIKEHFSGFKIAVFYKFSEELNVLKQTFGDGITTDVSVFNSTNKSIALQIVAGREGISLSMADYLVYYNIDFSATSYWQSRDRMTTIDRPKNDVFWIFSVGGIESDIYKTVLKKKNYTITHFKKTI